MLPKVATMRVSPIQLAVFLDSAGRSYSIPAHELPSAKGHGEPLTSSFTPPPGASFVGVMMGGQTLMTSCRKPASARILGSASSAKRGSAT